MTIIRSGQYFLMHTPEYLRRLQNVTLEDVKVFLTRILNMKSNLRAEYFRYISNFVLVLALSVGLYARWMFSQDTVILVIVMCSLFVLSISAALVYYFSMDSLGYCLGHLWIGALLGVIAFTDKSLIKYSTSEEVMNSLFVTSFVVRCFWNILERVLHIVPESRHMDLMELLGMCIASILCGQEFLSVCLLITALAVTVQAIRLKSFLAVLNLLVLCIFSAWQFFPKILQLSVNPFALTCFVLRISFEPIIDLYFSNLTMMQRWTPIFNQSSMLRRLGILLVVILEVTFYVLSARQIPRHKEWFIVVPIFVAFSLIWWSYHITFIITVWQLNNKITDCYNTWRNINEENHTLGSIMASKGVRHFSLIAQRLMSVTFISTVILTIIGWITKTATSLSLFLMIVPVEVVIMSLLWELGRVLGGTCAGYALVAPITPHKPAQVPKVLPTTAMQEMSSRATETLTTIQRFFNHYLIDLYGCDYSSSGLTLDAVENKLRNFFHRVTSDGPYFDTYLVYYSGHVYDNGDWALAENGSLKLDTILEWWRECSTAGSSRLILILDTSGSHAWIPDLRRHNDTVVAIQTCRALKKRMDMEEGGSFRVGDFTQEWVMYNCGKEGSGPLVDWQSKDRVLRAQYRVTKAWADFRFRMPTKDDIVEHWDQNFPKITKPLIKITNYPQLGHVLCCSDWLFRCVRRLRLRWLPPLELDTGHGFKLVRS